MEIIFDGSGRTYARVIMDRLVSSCSGWKALRPLAGAVPFIVMLLSFSSCDKHHHTDTQESPYSAEDLDFDASIQNYLKSSFSSEITDVTVTDDKVRITGCHDGEEDFFLAEIPPYMDLLRLDTPLTSVPARELFGGQASGGSFSGDFTVELDRHVSVSGGLQYDRLLSKWALFEETGDGSRLVSAAHYADEVALERDPEPVPLKNKKGIGGISANRFVSDFDDLGIGSATLNMYVTSFTFLSPVAGTVAHEYGGRTYYFDENYLKSVLDASLLEAGKRNMAVAAILLVQPASAAVDRQLGNLLMNDGCNGGTLTLPDMTSAEAVNCFAAIVDFLAERYTREDSQYGRIAQWIVMNEVDIASIWANIGTRPELVFTDYYIKILRMVNNIVRQYDRNAETFVSMSHSWTGLAGDYPVKSMLGTINTMGKMEGDYRWALAYHSYAGDLLNPRCWECPWSTFSMDTHFVTFKNLEVMNEWIYMPENMYQGTQKRSVWLSEAGLNSRSYSDADLQEQAAGWAYAWKKIKALPGIDGIQWHNWFDNEGDGSGALLGLRKYNDDVYGGEAKPVWELYRVSGTSEEDVAFSPYLDIIGIEDWDIIQPVL